MRALLVKGVKLAESETRPTLNTAVIDGWVKGWSLSNPLGLEAGYRPATKWYLEQPTLSTKQQSRTTRV